MKGKQNKTINGLLGSEAAQGTQTLESTSPCVCVGGVIRGIVMTQFPPLSECLLPTQETDVPLCTSLRSNSENNRLVPFHGYQMQWQRENGSKNMTRGGTTYQKAHRKLPQLQGRDILQELGLWLQCKTHLGSNPCFVVHQLCLLEQVI